jgi:hypothetical protein
MRSRPIRTVSGAKPWTARFDHVAGRVTVFDQGGVERATFATSDTSETPLIPLPADRPLQIEVVHANPLLYDYDATVTTVQERKVRTCRNVLGTFTNISLQIQTLGLAGIAASKISLDTILRQTLTTESLAAPTGFVGRGDADVSRELSDLDVLVTQFAAQSASVMALSRSTDDSLGVIAELGETTDAELLLGRLHTWVSSQLPNVKTAADVGAAYQQARTAAVPLAAKAGQVMADSKTSSDSAAAKRLRTRADSALSDLRRGYRTLQGQLHQIEQARAATTQRFTVAPSGDFRRLTIALTPTKQFTDVPRLRQGSVDAITDPTPNWTCKLAIGLSLMEPPKGYAMHGDTVADVTSPDQRSAASVLLHLDWRKTPVPVGAVLGAGLGASHRPDWYTGLSWQFSDAIRLNSGAVWQRIQRLPSGVVSGILTKDPVIRQAIQNGNPAYRPAFFWGLSIGG